ncbi:MAG: YadA-like family protein [Arsenophonus sp. NEOnobi-MAG3]
MNKKIVLASTIMGALTNVWPVLAIESDYMEKVELAQSKAHKISGINSYSAGSYANSNGDSSVAIGLSSNSWGDDSLALGRNAVARERSSVALGSDSLANRQYDKKILEAILVEQDNQINSKSIREVSLGSKIPVSGFPKFVSQITHVAPGTEDTDAVNLYQLKKVKLAVDERIGEVDKIKTTKNNLEQFQNEAKVAYEATVKNRDNTKSASEVTTEYRNNANIALTETQNHRDNAYDALTRVKVYENSADSIVKRLKKEASLVEWQVTHDSDWTMYLGKELEGSHIFVSGKHGDRVISGVANGVRNTDAVNAYQLNTVRTTTNYASKLAQKNSSQINHLEDRFLKNNTKIERGLATAAALTGLFQPYGVGKVNFTAGIGGYASSQALAVGTGYRITENAAVKAGVAYSGGNNVMYNASFNVEW